MFTRLFSLQLAPFILLECIISRACFDSKNATVFFSVGPSRKGGMLSNIANGDRGNWGYESWRLSLYANGLVMSMRFIFGDDWNDACKLNLAMTWFSPNRGPWFSCNYARVLKTIGNSIICSDIWHTYHVWYFRSREASEIWDSFEKSRVVIMPNIRYKSCYYLFILLPAKGL